MNIHKTTTVIITQVSSFKQWVYEITLQNNNILLLNAIFLYGRYNKFPQSSLHNHCAD